MDAETKRLIRVRAAKRARFKRGGYGTKKQLSDSWRRPRGLQSKQRLQKKAKGAHPTPGFGSPVAVRGLHPSGYEDILVHNPMELEGLDAATQAVRIAGLGRDEEAGADAEPRGRTRPQGAEPEGREHGQGGCSGRRGGGVR